MGGKPSKSTPADMRLSANKRSMPMSKPQMPPKTKAPKGK